MKTEKLVFAFIALAFLFSCNDDNDEPNDSKTNYRISEVIALFDGVEGEKRNFTYTDEKLTLMTNSHKNENTWEERQKWEISYNGSTVTVLYYDKESNGDWELDGKLEFVFNNDLMTQEKHYYQSLGNLALNYRYDYQYNGTTLIGYEEYDYDMSGMGDLETKGECVYSNDLVSILEFNEYELDDTEWIQYKKHAFSYSDTKLKEVINYNQGYRTSDLTLHDKDVYTFNGNLVSAIDNYDWNDDSRNWELNNAATYRYNDQENLIEVNTYNTKLTISYEEGKGNSALLFNTPRTLIYQIPNTGGGYGG